MFPSKPIAESITDAMVHTYTDEGGSAIFVVEVVVDSETIDYKAFGRREDALARYRSTIRQTNMNEFDLVALYHVQGADDPELAVDLVKKGPSPRGVDPAVVLLEISESPRRTLNKLIAKTDWGIDDL